VFFLQNVFSWAALVVRHGEAAATAAVVADSGVLVGALRPAAVGDSLGYNSDDPTAHFKPAVEFVLGTILDVEAATALCDEHASLRTATASVAVMRHTFRWVVSPLPTLYSICQGKVSMRAPSRAPPNKSIAHESDTAPHESKRRYGSTR
jgi:hypothetical protein